MALSQNDLDELRGLKEIYSPSSTPANTITAPTSAPNTPGVGYDYNFTPKTDVPGYVQDQNITGPSQTYDRIWQDARKYWQANQSPYARLDKNLVRGTADTNVNNRTHADTLRYQRLVDKLNNKVYREPIKLGYTGFTPHGSTSVQGEGGKLYQMPKIETEETRQMERMRGYETTEREKQMDLRNKYETYDYLMQELHSIQKLELTGKYSEAELQKEKDIINEKLHIWRMENEYSYNKAFTQFERRLVQQIGREDANVVLKLFTSHGPAIATVVGTMLSKLNTSMPSAQQAVVAAQDADVLQYLYNGGDPNVAVAKIAQNHGTNIVTTKNVLLPIVQREMPDLAQELISTTVDTGKAAWKGATGS